MDDKLVCYKNEEEKDNNRKIEDEIGKIYADPKMTPFGATIAMNLGLHRNTVKGSRKWHLTRPLHLGDEFLPAGRLVSLKDLFDIIKEHRRKKAERRTKKQIRRAEDLTEELAGLEEILQNMMADNADLMFEIDDLKTKMKRTAEVHKFTIFRLNDEICELKDRIKELGRQRSKPGNEASIYVIKPQTEKD